MNANLQPKMPVIKSWLMEATAKLKDAEIPSAKLDAEIILAHTIRKNRTYLHAHSDDKLSDRHKEIADARLRLRLDRTPIAYIIGHKDFYGRMFQVTPATLIPRPESEAIITLLKELTPKNAPLIKPSAPRLVDIGTGSGCLGITAKLELPDNDVTLIDISRHALNVAEKNAKTLGAEVTLLQSDLLTRYPFTADAIVANLPYVDPKWERSPETNYEPETALFAKENGLHLIFKLIDQTTTQLNLGGHLLLEADPRQHEAIIVRAKTAHLALRKTDGFVLLFTKS